MSSGISNKIATIGSEKRDLLFQFLGEPSNFVLNFESILIMDIHLGVLGNYLNVCARWSIKYSTMIG